MYVCVLHAFAHRYYMYIHDCVMMCVVLACIVLCMVCYVIHVLNVLCMYVHVST